MTTSDYLVGIRPDTELSLDYIHEFITHRCVVAIDCDQFIRIPRNYNFNWDSTIKEAYIKNLITAIGILISNDLKFKTNLDSIRADCKFSIGDHSIYMFINYSIDNGVSWTADVDQITNLEQMLFDKRIRDFLMYNWIAYHEGYDIASRLFENRPVTHLNSSLKIEYTNGF